MTMANTASYSAWSDLAANMLRTRSTSNYTESFLWHPFCQILVNFLSSYLEELYVLRSNYTPETKDAIAN